MCVLGVCAGLSIKMRCAERTGTCLMLWQHEFYMVMEPRHGAYLYQALEFQVGINLPPEEVQGSTQRQKKEVWVRGVAYAPALHVRKFNTVEQRKGYLFHSEFNDGDGDTALFGKCPEVVRVDNCTAWRPMSSVLETIPRVIHTYTGYGLQLTYDVPMGKYNGVLCVRVCWHDIVYLAQLNFAKKELLL